MDLKEERDETARIERLQEDYAQVQRKFHKRNEPGNKGYANLKEYWKDFSHVVQLVIHLKTSSSIQLLLNLTGDFHDACDAFKKSTDMLECQEYFKVMEFSWKYITQHHTTDATEKVRILNLFRDGQDRASRLGLGEVYTCVIQWMYGD